VLSEAGLPQDEILRLSSVPFRQSGPFRLVSVGRLLHLKGFALGLQAFARIQDRYPDSEYWIFGEGPERKRLEKQVLRLGIATKVRFWGKIARGEVLEKLSDCDVLVHPSLHDSGGWVCLEAMAAGRPVVCLDLGGPGLQVTEHTGIKVSASTPAQTVADMAEAFRRLAGDPELRIRMGEACRQRVTEHFASAGKGDFMNTLYENVAARPGLALANPVCVPEPRIEP